MRRQLFLLLSIAVCSVSAQTADPLASDQTRKILQYLKGLNQGNSRRLISGHQMNTQYSPLASYDSAITALYKTTGKYVGLVGIDYQRTVKGLVTSMSGSNAPLIHHFRSGGLVAVMCSFTNPWTDSTMNDTTGRSRLSELLQAGSVANSKWMQRLDSLAAGLRQLQDSGVTVLFRPLHEMNGAWFWWGSQSITQPSPVQWTTLWKSLFTYFTQTKQLHNLLWVFSPSARPSLSANPVFKADTTFYPGKDYVDIVGVDVYNDTLDIPFYSALRSFGKPLALCEFGPGLPSAEAPYRYDYRILLNQIKQKYPDIVYWMSWNDFGNALGSRYYGMTKQNHSIEVLQDSWVLNRDALQWQTTTKADMDQMLPPKEFALQQNYPNPFNPSTMIRYDLPKSASVILKVFNALGQEVALLVNEQKNAGSYAVNWSANLPSGIYFCRLQAAGFAETKKMILLH